MVQHSGGPSGAAPAPEGSRDRPFANQGAPGPVGRRMLASRELDAAMDRHSSGDSGPVPPGGSTEAADPCTPPRGTTRDSRASVLQDGILQPHRQPQGEYGARAGLVRQAGGIRTPHHGDRGRAVGHGPPSPETATGRALLEKDPHHPGSLGIAVSEGLEDAGRDEKAIYCLGSVLNHVLLHQTVIGLETQRQFEQIGEYPDLMVSSLGGGSNFGGFTLPFFADALRGKAIRFLAAQSAAAPNLQGEYRYDFADHAELTPMLKMYTLGHRTEMKPVRGDGLRYHGCSPILSLLRHRGLIDTIAYPTDERHAFERARMFVQAEGFLPAPESAYSIACAMDEALKAKESGERSVIAFNVSGHGFMDMEGYADVLGL